MSTTKIITPKELEALAEEQGTTKGSLLLAAKEAIPRETIITKPAKQNIEQVLDNVPIGKKIDVSSMSI